jgi:4-amino-4-deoxy-L-arabinose transferase-like glycosyltransferase
MSEPYVPTPPVPLFTREGKDRRLRGGVAWDRTRVLPGATSALLRRTAFLYRDLTLGQATLIVVIAGLLWRTVRFALAFPLWGDEAFVAVTLLTRDLAGLARPLEYFQIAPPGFLWVEWLAVYTIGTSEWALRLIPYLAGVASLVLFWRFCAEVASRRTVLLAVAVMAASFYPVRHSTEVKPYAIDLLVSLILIAAGWATGRNIRSAPAWLALLVASTLGPWCSYTAIFTAAGVAMFLGARVIHEQSIRLGANWLVYVLTTMLSWAVVFVAFGQPQANAADSISAMGDTWTDAFPPLAEPSLLPWWVLEVHTGNMVAYPYGGNNLGSTLTTVLVVAGCIRMWRRPPRGPLLFLLLSPLPVAMIAAALHRYPYGTSTRVMLYMAPAFCLLTGEGIMAFLQLRRWTRDGPLVVGGSLAAVALVCMAFNVISPYKAYDDVLHRSLVRWVAGCTAPGDQWVVFNGASPPPFVKGLMVMPWLQRVAEARFYLLTNAPVPLHWEPDPETIVPRTGTTVWLIIQNHGDAEFFPTMRLADYQYALEARLGPPRATTFFKLPRDETWSICEYSATDGAAP